jgi:hypothetical protein
MDVFTLSPRTLAALDTASGDRLLPFVRDAYGNGHDVDLRVHSVGLAHEIVARAHCGPRVVREARWPVARLGELPERIGLTLLLAYIDGVRAETDDWRSRRAGAGLSDASPKGRGPRSIPARWKARFLDTPEATMGRKMILDMGCTFAKLAARDDPPWIAEGAYPLGEHLPSEDAPGRVLAYAPISRFDHTRGYVFVGSLEGAVVDRAARVLRFDWFSWFEPVETGRVGDDSPARAEHPHRSARFAYLSEDAFQRVITEGCRRTFRLSEAVATGLPGFSVEHGVSEDEVADEALREYMERREWIVSDD